MSETGEERLVLDESRSEDDDGLGDNRVLGRDLLVDGDNLRARVVELLFATECLPLIRASRVKLVLGDPSLPFPCSSLTFRAGRGGEDEE